MSGIEIERMLRRMDANFDANAQIQRTELLRYIREHETAIFDELISRGEASIPTSTGVVTIPMSALKAATI